MNSKSSNKKFESKSGTRNKIEFAWKLELSKSLKITQREIMKTITAIIKTLKTHQKTMKLL